MQLWKRTQEESVLSLKLAVAAVAVDVVVVVAVVQDREMGGSTTVSGLKMGGSTTLADHRMDNLMDHRTDDTAIRASRGTEVSEIQTSSRPNQRKRPCGARRDQTGTRPNYQKLKLSKAQDSLLS